MSRWRPEPLVLALAGPHLVAADSDAVPATRSLSMQDVGALTAQALQPLAAAHPGPRAVHLLLGAEQVRHFVLTPPAGALALADLQSLATQRATRLFGEVPGGWAVVADWRLDADTVCAAIEQRRLVDWTEAFALLGWRLASVRSGPLAVLASVEHSAPAEGLTVLTWPGQAALAQWTRYGLVGLRLLDTRAADDDRACLDLLQREARRHAVRSGAELTQLHWLRPPGAPPQGAADRGGADLPLSVQPCAQLPTGAFAHEAHWLAAWAQRCPDGALR